MKPADFPFRLTTLAGLALLAIGLALQNAAVWLIGIALFIVGVGGTRRTKAR